MTNVAIGSFVELRKEYFEIDKRFANINNIYGIIVSRADLADHKVSFLVSIREFKGDYVFVLEDEIKRTMLDMSVLDKLNFIAQFDGFWYTYHKTIYQKLLIDAVTNYFS